MSTESWALYSIGVAVTISRTYARMKSTGSIRALNAEDYLVWIAILFYSAQTALAYSVGAAAWGLANNGMSDAQRAALAVSDPEYQLRVLGSKIQVAGWTTYSVLIWSLKLSILSFYLRLTDKLSTAYRRPIYVGFGLVVGTFLASILTVFTACRPFHQYWQINPDPGNACQPAISGPIVWASFASNVSTDIYLIFIPIPMLWKSRLKLIKKVAATIIFGFGLFVLVCAILKSVFVLVDPVHGAELAGAWGTREAFVAVITANLPMMFHLFKSWVGRLRLFRSALGSTDDGPYKYPTPSGPRSVHHITNTAGLTFCESEEQIVGRDEVEMYPVGGEPYPGTIVVSKQIEIVHETHKSIQGCREALKQ